jgi:hypothetical protein
MKPRSKPLSIPSPLPDRYWLLTIGDHAPLTFRHPYYGVASSVVRCLIAHRDQDRDLSPQETAERVLPFAGLVVGVCWYDSGRELETQLDLAKLENADLLAYGNKVAEELQDNGFTLLDLIELLAGIAPELYQRQSLINMAMARSSFSAAPTDGLTLS